MGADLTGRGRHVPVRLVTAGVFVLMALVLCQAPSGADARSAVPPVPTLVIALSQGVNANGALPITARSAVITDVGWVQNRLAVTLPRIKWTEPLPLVDGVFGPSTTAGVVFFKKWANNAHKLLHLPPLFKTTDGGVGPSTIDILAIVAGYFQLHPGKGSVSLPESADQQTEMLLMNQDRVHVKVAPLVANAQLMGIAQAFSNHLASIDKLADPTSAVTPTQLTVCASDATEQEGEQGGGGPIAALDTFMLNGANADPPVATSATVDASWDQAGTGVSHAANGDLFLVQTFLKTC